MKRIFMTAILFPLFLIDKPAQGYQVNPDILHNHLVKYSEFNRFLSDIRVRESGNKYFKINPFGYIGAYQFGQSALSSLGIRLTANEFSHDSTLFLPSHQDETAKKWFVLLEKRLTADIRKHEGDTVNGQKITKSGILAAGHLAGITGVKRYFRTARDPADINGTRLTDYLIEFSGYNF